jgi:hypothetical protein
LTIPTLVLAVADEVIEWAVMHRQENYQRMAAAA